jgi:transcription elongation factor GreA
MTITFFRLMNELKKLEQDGNRLKNMALESLFANEAFVLRDIIRENDRAFIGRIYDVFLNLSYVEESHKEKFLSLVKEKFSDFSVDQLTHEELLEQDVEIFIVTQEGYNRKKDELDSMVKVEMVQLSRELSKVSEATGDLRENVEYNALMERQAILEASISKLDKEMQKASILDPARVNTEVASIGTRVSLDNVQTGERIDYMILGPWDADFEKNILSYRSPIARTILGKKVNEELELKIDDSVEKFRIISIERK